MVLFDVSPRAVVVRETAGAALDRPSAGHGSFARRACLPALADAWPCLGCGYSQSHSAPFGCLDVWRCPRLPPTEATIRMEPGSSLLAYRRGWAAGGDRVL